MSEMVPIPILLDTDLKILKISSISESPGNSGFLVHISAKMQPMDHISTPVEYCRPPSRISGALYHSVTTYTHVKIEFIVREVGLLPREYRFSVVHQRLLQDQSPQALDYLPYL